MPPTTDETELARFQAALLELLSQPVSVEEMARRLREEDAFAAYREYSASFEPRFLEVAAALVKKWGRSSHAGGKTEGVPREGGTFPGYTTARDFELHDQ